MRKKIAMDMIKELFMILFIAEMWDGNNCITVALEEGGQALYYHLCH